MNDNRAASVGKSFLIADCGSTTTTVALFDVVAGEHRLVARATSPTTAGGPWNDIVVGVQQAMAQISEVTGRLLLTEKGELISPPRPSGAGVDTFGATVSAAAPLRTLVAGLLEDVSVASARRALHTIYATEVEAFSLADERDEQERINALLAAQPELILLTGGTDGGDNRRLRNLIDLVALGTTLMDGGRDVHVIFAGNRELRERVTNSLASHAQVHVADNVRPLLEVEELDQTVQLIGDLYETIKLKTVPGIGSIAAWSGYPLLPSARAFGGIIEYFAALYQERVLGVDLGSNSVTLTLAANDQQHLTVKSDLGMGQPLSNLFFDQIPVEEIAEWLPVDISIDKLHDYVADKVLHPYTVPMTEEDLYLEQTLARHVLRFMMQEVRRNWQWPSETAPFPTFDLLVMRGDTLTQTSRPGQSILMMLDALQPVGIFSIAMDHYGVLPMLGLLAPYEPLSTVQILEGGTLLDLGWVVVPAGPMKGNQEVLKAIVDSPRQGQLKIDLKAGELVVLPLAPGEVATLTLEPARGIDVGSGPGRNRQVTIHGGTVGLVIDARGRPLQLPDDKEERRSQLRKWHWDMGG